MKAFVFGISFMLFFLSSPTITAQVIVSVAQDSLNVVLNAARQELALMELKLQRDEKDVHRMKIERHDLEMEMKGETPSSKVRHKSPRLPEDHLRRPST